MKHVVFLVAVVNVTVPLHLTALRYYDTLTPERHRLLQTLGFKTISKKYIWVLNHNSKIFLTNNINI